MACDVDAERLGRGDVERVDCWPCREPRCSSTVRQVDKAREGAGERLGAARRGGGERIATARRDVDRARWEAGERLPAAGRCDEKCIATARDFVEKLELMRVGGASPAHETS